MRMSHVKVPKKFSLIKWLLPTDDSFRFMTHQLMLHWQQSHLAELQVQAVFVVQLALFSRVIGVFLELVRASAVVQAANASHQ